MSITVDEKCREVFDIGPTEEVCDYEYEGGQLILYMCDNKDGTCWRYEPDMTDRPQALDYILGKRNDFND